MIIKLGVKSQVLAIKLVSSAVEAMLKGIPNAQSADASVQLDSLNLTRKSLGNTFSALCYHKGRIISPS